MNVPDDFGVSENQLTELVVRSDLRAVRVPETRILALVAQHHYDPDATFAIKLSLEEALTNAIKHGNCNNPHKYVTIRYYVDGERAVVMVRDEGCGFVLDEIPDPTADENLERPSGRGLMLIQSYMTHVEFRNPGNEVWMLKLRQSGKP